MASISGKSRWTHEDPRTRVRTVLAELAQAAQANVSAGQFLHAWLNGVLSATDGEWGAISELSGDRFQMALEMGTPADENLTGEVLDRRLQFRRRAIAAQEATWLPPRSTVEPFARASDSDHFILVAPISPQRQWPAIVELAFPGTVEEGVREIWVRFVSQAVGLVDDYLLRSRLRNAERRQGVADAAVDFVRSVNKSIDLQSAAYTVVNEARRFVECDSVCFLRRHGSRYRAEAVSGAEQVDKRSMAVKALVDLTEAAALEGRTFDSDAAPGTFSPAMEQALSTYVDLTDVKHVVVVPLHPPAPPEPTDETKKVAKPIEREEPPFGALVFERRLSAFSADGAEERLRFVAEASTAALANALQYDQTFLLPLTKRWLKVKRKLSAPGGWVKPTVIASALAVLTLLAIFVPADFTLSAPGVLQPVERSEVFAPLDGTVVELKVRHGSRVKKDDPLVTLRNTDLDVQLAEARGERTVAQEQLTSIERSLFGDDKQLTVEQRVRLSGERAQLIVRLKALADKLAILERKSERLVVKSPADGEVITWNVERLLRNRPVVQGQSLLTVAAVDRAWEVEVDLPERYAGHVQRARNANDGPLQVDFRPLADPSSQYVGRLIDLDGAAQVRGEHGNTVKATVAIEVEQLTSVKPGAEVRTKIHCGRRTLGYVWLHDVADFLRANVWFRLF